MRGGRFLEAPVSGSRKSAENGQVVILAAGDRSLYMDGYSCFEAMGRKTFFLGTLFVNMCDFAVFLSHVSCSGSGTTNPLYR